MRIQSVEGGTGDMLRLKTGVFAVVLLAACSSETISLDSQSRLSLPPEETVGEVGVLIADDFDGGTFEKQQYLLTEGGSIIPLPESEETESLRSGATVSLSYDETVEPEFSILGVLPKVTVIHPAPPPPHPDKQKFKVAVLLVYFNDRPLNSPPASPTRQEVARAMFHPVRTSVNSFYKENSQGLLSFNGGEEENVFGWYRLNRPPTCDLFQFEHVIQEAATAADADLNLQNFTHILLVGDFGLCGWAGLGTLGTSPLPVRTADGSFRIGKAMVKSERITNPFYAAHELGHTLGLHHAGHLYCPSGSHEPYFDYQEFTSSCFTQEYGDWYSVMGGNPWLSHFSAPHKLFMGWVSESDTAELTEPGIYSLGVLSKPYSGKPRSYYVRQFKRTGPTFTEEQKLFIEYRQPYGLDQSIMDRRSDVFNGPILHCSKAGSTKTKIIAATHSAPTARNISMADWYIDLSANYFRKISNNADSAEFEFIPGHHMIHYEGGVTEPSFQEQAILAARVEKPELFSRANIYVNYSTEPTLSTTLLSSPLQATFPTQFMPNGTHVATVHLIDKKGNESFQDLRFSVANTDPSPPVITNFDRPPSVMALRDLRIPVSATDNVGVYKVELLIDYVFNRNGVASGLYDGVSPLVVSSTDTTAPYLFLRSIAEGVYRFQIRAFDYVLNRAETEIFGVVVDRTLPELTPEIAPAPNSTVINLVEFSMQATDILSGISRAELLIDTPLNCGGVCPPPAQIKTSAPYHFVWDSRTVVNGPHTFRLRAVDAAGNTRTTLPISFHVENDLPIDPH